MTGLTAVSPTKLLVGVSISDSPNDELIERGLSELHVRHVFVEVVRHILAAGWSVAYGGDFRAAGYTETLLDLVRTYDRRDALGPERVLAYLAWPIWTTLTNKDVAEISNIATLKKTPAPAGAPSTLPPPESMEPLDRAWFSQSLSIMRTQMTADIDARVVLGGRVSGQQGLYPGVAEEAMLASASGVPLFVAGGFGGCARAIADALGGRAPRELSVEYQLAHTDDFDELVAAVLTLGLKADYEVLSQTFRAAGQSGLRNGLTDDENQELLATDDTDKLVSLVLRGLRRTVPDGPNS